MTAMIPVPSVLLDQLREAVALVRKWQDQGGAEKWMYVDATAAARAVVDAVQPTADICGEKHLLIGGGQPCQRPPGHPGRHFVDGLWWESDTPPAVQPTAEEEPTCKCGHREHWHWDGPCHLHVPNAGVKCDCTMFVPAPAVCPTEAEDAATEALCECGHSDRRHVVAKFWKALPCLDCNCLDWADTRLSDPAPSVPTTQERAEQAWREYDASLHESTAWHNRAPDRCFKAGFLAAVAGDAREQEER